MLFLFADLLLLIPSRLLGTSDHLWSYGFHHHSLW